MAAPRTRPASVALDFSEDARWRPMAAGVQFLMRPCGSLDRELAEGAARKAMRELADGELAFSAYGFEASSRPSLAEADVALKLGELLYRIELGVLLIEDWNWIDGAGAPVPVSRRAIARLLNDARIEEAFARAAGDQDIITVLEGNAFAAAPSGAGAAATTTADGATKGPGVGSA